MLEDSEWIIRKAIGRVVRDTSRKRPDLVSDWPEPRAGRASALAVREASNHLSDLQREQIAAARAK